VPKTFRLPTIYPITDTRISGLSHREQAELLIVGGAEIIQLREKLASPREFYDAARAALEVAKRHSVPVLINDRVDIALALGADGVHLGQDDLPPERARMILGEQAIIGFSTHSVEQAVAAAAMPVDYIAIGPIFATRTKENPDDIVGLDGLRRVREAIGRTPLVAIGGIDRERIPLVLKAGADSAAMVSGLLTKPDAISALIKEISGSGG
jgi:thiamine-phosphate pyrophosphorylase